jgi:NADH-quinone oxidoreductase subunit L
LALSGFPMTAGFFSKDAIVGASFARNWFLGALMLFTAFLTAYYTFRLYFRVFEGPLVTVPPPTPTHEDHGHDAHGAHEPSGHDEPHEEHAHNHEPFLMIGPLYILAIGALIAGYINWPFPHLGEFLGQSPSLINAYTLIKDTAAAPAELTSYMGQSTESEGFSLLMIFSGLVSIAAISLAYVFHLKDRAKGDALAEQFAPITRMLEAKFWVDEIYQDFIIYPVWVIGEISYWWDRWVIDLLVNLCGWICQLVGYLLKFATQRGYLQGYAAAMLLGVAAILLLMYMH